MVVICIASCTTSITPEIETNGEQLVVDSEIVPGQEVRVFLTTTASITGNSTHFYPVGNEAEVYLVGEDGEKRLTYLDNNPGVYINKSFQIEEGKEYELRANLTDSEAPSIFAETTVPTSTAINDVEILNQETIQNQDESYSLILDVSVAIDKLQDSSNYLHLIPQKVDESDPGNRPYLDLSRGNIELLNSFNAAKELEHKNGIFIDYNKLSSETIDLRITFNIGSNLENRPDHINFALRTTSEEYYDYHENLSRQLTIGSFLISDPIVEFTNIENGWGIFGSYSVSEFQVSL